MNNNDNISKLYSWPVIIIAFIIFWPVGLFLIYKRNKITKKIGSFGGLIVRLVSFYFFFLAMIGIMACLDTGFDSFDIGLIILFSGIGLSLFSYSKKIMAKADKNKNYTDIKESSVTNSNDRVEEISYDTEEIETKVVMCKSCGAQNKVTVNDIECEYCGSLV